MNKDIDSNEVVDPAVVQLIDNKLDGFMERIKATLEKAYPDKPVDLGPRIEYISRGPRNKYGAFAKSFEEKAPDTKFRFIYDHRDAKSLKLQDGWKPVKDEKTGDEVRFGDHILASMPKSRYENEIVARREQLIQHKRQANASKLEESAGELQSDFKKSHFSGIYDVKYDDVEGEKE